MTKSPLDLPFDITVQQINNDKGTPDYSKNNLYSNTQTFLSKGMKSKKNNSLYPYLQGEKVQVLSRVTEKRLVHKTATDFASSFPLAVSVYKANSDAHTPINKVRKKAKKSVLTLPNRQAPLPQACTVSDVNDSEYYLQRNPFDKKKVRKRRPDTDMRNSEVRENVIEFYDRDSLFCSQININADGSSIDMLRNYKGDGKRHCKKKRSNAGAKSIIEHTDKCQPQDVWAVLRNMNRFQFQDSPAVSIGSLESRKPKVTKTKSRNARITETHTEEYSYISSSYSLNIDDSPTLTRSSSLGRVTVIDKQEDFGEISMENFEHDVRRKRLHLKDFTSRNNSKQKKRIQKKKCRALKSIENKHDEEPTVNNTSVMYKNFEGLQQSNSDCRRSISDKENELLDDSTSTKKVILNTSCASNCNCDKFTNSCKSSKAELIDSKAKKLVSKDTNKSDDLVGHRKEIQNRHNNLYSDTIKILESESRKPRVKTTIHDFNLMPNFTKIDIKTRLSRLKMPIVILERDEIKSQIEVLDYDFPQFYGLDKNIWPFMVSWLEGSNIKRDRNVAKTSKETVKCSPHKLLNEHPSQRINLKDKNRNHKSYQKKTVPISLDAKKITKPKKVQEPRKDMDLPLEDNNEATGHDCNLENKYEIDTHIKIGPYIVYKAHIDAMVQSNPENRIENNCNPCAKAKLAKTKNDLVKNVISKISKGIYYSRDKNKYGGRPTATLRETVEFVYSKRMTQWNSENPLNDPNLSNLNNQYDLKENGVQVGTTSVRVSNRVIQTSNSIDKLVTKKINGNSKNISPIPGFNNGLSALQIETFNMNQISIKNIITNTKVRFDINVCADPNNIITKEVPSLIPLEVTESNTKIYKCKTTIVNAMLPGELCSVLSKLMNSFMEFTPVSESLSTISEHKSSLSFTNSLCENIQPFRRFLNGNFSEKYNICSKIAPLKEDNRPILNPKLFLKLKNISVLAPIFKNEMIFRNLAYHYDNLSSKYKPKAILPIDSLDETATISCKKLDIYSSKNKLITLPSEQCGMWMSNLMKNYNIKIDFKLSSYLDLLNFNNVEKGLTINVTMKTKAGDERSLILNISNTNVINATRFIDKCSLSNLYDGCQLNRDENEYNKKEIECDIISKKCNIIRKKYNGLVKSKLSKKKTLQYKLRRKSTYLIPGEKKSDTLLSNVSSVEDFFQILGPKKTFANVFDGYVTKIILSSLTEMKNWTTVISPQQALLILLLTNKKQTANLVRFRPLLLQGIAVKRITRISELDTEIEVIERENLTKIYQASDYQRPFDESSEKLLKSLVEKRKKLNPSYLRVMARYVGLGLLKPPIKKL